MKVSFGILAIAKLEHEKDISIDLPSIFIQFTLYLLYKRRRR